MAAKEAKHAMWLEKDGKRNLYHADDVEAAMLNGWTKVEGERANGELWNPEVEDDEAYPLDAAAEAMKATNEAKAKKDAKKAEEAKKAHDAAVKAGQDADNAAAMKVQVVDPPARNKK